MTKRALDGKKAIVVGGSRGIGRAIVEALAEAGAEVRFTWVKDERAAAAVEAAAAAKGGVAKAVRTDSTSAADVKALFDGAGAPDIVVNVAGVSRFGPIATATDEDFDVQLALNTRGAFFVLREAAKRIVDGGRIVQVSTGGTTSPSAGAGTYIASKAAGEQLAYALAREVGVRRVTVNVVSPGLTETDGLVLPKPALDHMVGLTPLGRLGQPADVAEAVLFLASDAGRWVTGHNLRATGGL
ncbi:MAG: SDR family oxidoreductase [Deltaproteobacteria bacterium]|nr:SDR family oxidoreductase [Deltaproteobacteria bacterium]